VCVNGGSGPRPAVIYSVFDPTPVNAAATIPAVLVRQTYLGCGSICVPPKPDGPLDPSAYLYEG